MSIFVFFYLRKCRCCRKLFLLGKCWQLHEETVGGASGPLSSFLATPRNSKQRWSGRWGWSGIGWLSLHEDWIRICSYKWFSIFIMEDKPLISSFCNPSLTCSICANTSFGQSCLKSFQVQQCENVRSHQVQCLRCRYQVWLRRLRPETSRVPCRPRRCASWRVAPPSSAPEPAAAPSSARPGPALRSSRRYRRVSEFWTRDSRWTIVADLAPVWFLFKNLFRLCVIRDEARLWNLWCWAHLCWSIRICRRARRRNAWCTKTWSACVRSSPTISANSTPWQTEWTPFRFSYRFAFCSNCIFAFRCTAHTSKRQVLALAHVRDTIIEPETEQNGTLLPKSFLHTRKQTHILLAKRLISSSFKWIQAVRTSVRMCLTREAHRVAGRDPEPGGAHVAGEENAVDASGPRWKALLRPETSFSAQEEIRPDSRVT